MKDENGEDKTLYARLGSRGYQAPEMLEQKGYKSDQIDIFACGVILFCLLKGEKPFEEALASDRFFKLLKRGDISKFWTRHKPRNVADVPSFLPSADF